MRAVEQSRCQARAQALRPPRVRAGLASATLPGLGYSQREPCRPPGTAVCPDRLDEVSSPAVLGHPNIMHLVTMAQPMSASCPRLPEPVVFSTAAGGALAMTMLIGHFVEQPMIRRLRPWVQGA